MSPLTSKLFFICILLMLMAGCVSIKYSNQQFKYEPESSSSEFQVNVVETSRNHLAFEITENSMTKLRQYYKSDRQVCKFGFCDPVIRGRWKKDEIRHCRNDKKNPCYKTKRRTFFITAEEYDVSISQVVKNCEIMRKNFPLNNVGKSWALQTGNLDLSDAFVELSIKSKRIGEEAAKVCLNCNESLDVGCML